MQYKDAQKIVNTIESQINVENIEYKGYLIWPILKYYFFFGLFKTQQTSNNEKIVVTKTPIYVRALKKITRHFFDLKNVIKNYLSFHAEWKHFKSTITQKDILVVDVNRNLYEDTIENKSYSRYINPYVEFFKQNHTVILLNIEEHKNQAKEKYEKPTYINSYPFITYQKIKKQYQKNKNSYIVGFNSFLSFFTENFYQNIVDEKYIKEVLDEVIIYEAFWDKIINKINPKVIFLECYYGNQSHYGLISAAKKRGIKTVDIQHGVSFDAMYIDWFKKTTGRAYDFLPDFFWCWSKLDVELVLNSRKKTSQFMPVLGGNLWFAKNLNESIENKNNELIKSLIDKKTPTKVILVSLQHSIPVSSMLIDAIKKADENWLWLIRFHPRDYVDPLYRLTYIKHFDECNNIEYKLTTESNLYGLFRVVDYHVTHYSNVSIEAISYEIPSVLIGDEFQEQFQQYIEAGVFQIATNSDQIIKIIDNNYRVDKEKTDYFKMQSSETVAFKLLDTVLNNVSSYKTTSCAV